MAMAIQITHYLHTAIRVSDLTRAEHFYGTVLGLPKVDRTLRFPGAWFQLGDVQIHLIADSEAVADGPVSEKWGRDRHLAFAVTDLDTTCQTLVDQGCPLQRSASGRPAVFTQDPNGNVIELTQVD
jgi:glyoxylase I family protein